MKIFAKNGLQLFVVNHFCKAAPSKMFYRALNRLVMEFHRSTFPKFEYNMLKKYDLN